MIPTSAHNEALTGDTLYSAFLNHEWRSIVLPFVIRGMAQLAAAIEDESERQDFEVLYGAMIDDFYNEDVMDSTPVGTINAFIGDVGSIPTKWRICDGDSLSMAVFPELAIVVQGTPYDDNPNIILPDLSSQFIYGALADGTDIGDSGGAETHTLTTAETPAHTHDVGVSSATGSGNRAARGTSTLAVLQATTSVGGGAAHNNMPPYIKLLYIIKVLP